MSTPESTPESTPDLLTLRGLAQVIGVDAGQLSREARRPGFPSRATDNGVLYEPAEVQAWRAANVRTKRSAPPTSPTAPPAGTPAMPNQPRARPGVRPGDPADADLLEVLQSGKSSALEISRATVQIASRRVARGHHAGALGHNDLDGLKKSLQELRTAEADYVALETQRGQLVPRGHVLAIVSEACNRLVRVLSGVENSIATEFSVWLADPKVAAMPADERSRLVRGYVAGAARAARCVEADEIDRLINTAAAD